MKDCRNEDQQPGEELFTFAVRYSHCVEEIDIFAANEHQAWERVNTLIHADYELPFEELTLVEPGGSAGLITYTKGI